MANLTRPSAGVAATVGNVSSLYKEKKKTKEYKTIIVLNQSCTFFEGKKRLPAITVITFNIMLCPVRYPTFLEIIMSSFFFLFLCVTGLDSAVRVFFSSSLS